MIRRCYNSFIRHDDNNDNDDSDAGDDGYDDDSDHDDGNDDDYDDNNDVEAVSDLVSQAEIRRMPSVHNSEVVSYRFLSSASFSSLNHLDCNCNQSS